MSQSIFRSWLESCMLGVQHADMSRTTTCKSVAQGLVHPATDAGGCRVDADGALCSLQGNALRTDNVFLSQGIAMVVSGGTLCTPGLNARSMLNAISQCMVMVGRVG